MTFSLLTRCVSSLVDGSGGLVAGRASYGASVWREAGRATGCRRICYGEVHLLARMVSVDKARDLRAGVDAAAGREDASAAGWGCIRLAGVVILGGSVGGI
jgi:hypothetical protein